MTIGLIAGGMLTACAAAVSAQPPSFKPNPPGSRPGVFAPAVDNAPAPDANPAAKGTMIPGPGSITLVVVAGGCMVYGRKRRHERT